jgi:17-hydroxy-3-oxo-4-pregnene-20-carboxyl-CoA lyase
MSTLKGKAAIVGIGQTTFSAEPSRNRLDLACEAIIGAAEDAGIDVKDVDGIVRYTIDGSGNDQILVSNLGIRDLAFSVEIPFYGGSGCAAVGAAAAAVAAGLANNVVIYRAFTLYDMIGFAKRNSSTIWAMEGGVADYMRPYGWLSMMDTYALTYEAHRAKYGTTTEQLGAIAVAIRNAANRNPNAILKDVPLTLEDHRKAPVVSGRLTVDDVTLSSCEGAAAVLVTSTERARDLRRPAVVILGAASGLGPDPSLNWEMHLFKEDPTVSPAAYVAPRVFGMAGVEPTDIDVAQIYDCSTVNVLLQLEDYGFCKKGEGGPFVEGGRVELGGELPITTSGGMLAEAPVHGFNHVTEGAKQIRGTSSSQVPEAQLCLVTSSVPTPTSAVILGK